MPIDGKIEIYLSLLVWQKILSLCVWIMYIFLEKEKERIHSCMLFWDSKLYILHLLDTFQWGLLYIRKSKTTWIVHFLLCSLTLLLCFPYLLLCFIMLCFMISIQTHLILYNLTYLLTSYSTSLWDEFSVDCQIL